MQSPLIEFTFRFVKERLSGAESGHDYFHVERVYKTAMWLCEGMEVDTKVVALGALLHDIADPKFHGGDENLALTISRDFLLSQKVDEATIEEVLFIIKHISFKNREQAPKELPIELKIVQDADRLDALGAIGIARTFNFGGYKGSPMHDPKLAPRLSMSKEEYKKSEGTTLNHFHEKLFLLKDMLHLERSKSMAAARHAFMEEFVQRFLSEWEQKDVERQVKD